jgi:hypothetical protein
MADVQSTHTLLELLVVAQCEAIEKQEQELRDLPTSVGYLEKADCLRSGIAELEGRAERLTRMIEPVSPPDAVNVDKDVAA